MRLLEKRIHDGGGGGGGSIVDDITDVAAAVTASPTRYFWNCRIRHSEGSRTHGFRARERIYAIKPRHRSIATLIFIPTTKVWKRDDLQGKRLSIGKYLGRSATSLTFDFEEPLYENGHTRDRHRSIFCQFDRYRTKIRRSFRPS